MTIKLCMKPGLIALRMIARSLMLISISITTLNINVAQAQTVAPTPALKTTNATITSARKSNAGIQHWLDKNVDNQPSVLAAKSALDAARFQLIAAGKALYNPALEINAENAETRVKSIGISQTIDWGNIRDARTQMATAQQRAANFVLEKVRRKVTVQLLAALAEYHTTTALAVLAEQAEQLMQRFAKLAKRRFDAGDLGQVEADLAKLSSAQSRFKRANALSAQARAKQNLAVLTGTIHTHLPAFISSFPNPQSATKNIAQTLQRLPQVQALMAHIAALRAQVDVRASEATAKPTITLRAGKENQDRLLGITLSIPLQLRNNFRAEVKVANAQLIQAESETQQIYRKLRGRLQIATITYALSRNAWFNWQADAANSLSLQIKLLERLWRAGELSTTDYLVQLKQTVEAKTSAIKQRGRMWTNWSKWLLASGEIQRWIPNKSGIKQ